VAEGSSGADDYAIDTLFFQALAYLWCGGLHQA
jgi:hypothetical protein